MLYMSLRMMLYGCNKMYLWVNLVKTITIKRDFKGLMERDFLVKKKNCSCPQISNTSKLHWTRD